MSGSNYEPPKAPVNSPGTPSWSMPRWVYGVIALVGVPTLLLGSYSGYVEWDIANVRSMCSALKAGTTIADARRIIADHHFRKDFPFVSTDFPNGIPSEPPGTWYYAIPAATTYGDMSCGIEHDGKVVLSAEASGP